MADPRRLFARRRRSGRARTVRRVVAAAAALMIVAGGVWLVYFSTFLAASSVRVEGVDQLTEEQIVRAAGISTGEPMARLDLAAAERRVRAIPAVAAVDISRDWPSSVVVSVTERTPVALVVDARSVRAVDAGGVLFRLKGPKPDLPRLVVSTGGDASAVRGAARVISAMPRRLSAKVREVRAETMDSITLRLRDGDTVRWGSADDSGAKARVLSLLLGRKASVYDVSVPDFPTITG